MGIRITVERGSAVPDPFRPSAKRRREIGDMGTERMKWIVHRIVRHLRSRARPVYLGELCVETGVSLSTMEAIVEELTDRGALRLLTEREKLQAGIDRRGVIVILLDHTIVPEAQR